MAENDAMLGGVAKNVAFAPATIEKWTADAKSGERSKTTMAGATEEIDGDGFNEVIGVMRGVDLRMMFLRDTAKKSVAGFPGAFFGDVFS